jgi:lipopolysaccharide/colanic/teichoic acid biosynthesis glycosyltransferase
VKAWPILLDLRPEYAQAAGGGASALLAPLGTATALGFMLGRLSALGHGQPMIVPAFDPGPAYRERMEAAGAAPGSILTAAEAAARIADLEPSDWLVILDPRCVPATPLKPADVLTGRDVPHRVRHLVAAQAHHGGAIERVRVGADGAVGRIQRYYDCATWPIAAGVACSVVPVSCTLDGSGLVLTSLGALRRALADQDVPGTDVFLRGGCYDLSRERDLLALSERLVVDHFAGHAGGWQAVSGEAVVDPSARLLGPVVVHEGAVVGADAMVVGPAVVGPRARIEAGAVVAQCVVAQEAAIPAGAELRHRVYFGGPVPAGSVLPPPVSDAAPLLALAESRDRRGGSSGAYAFLKAAFDVVAAALGLLVLSPLLALVAALVKLDSRGPVFYGDLREGRDGVDFACLKFRTMRANANDLQRGLMAANEVDGPMFKMRHDPRVTRVGRVLRKLNIDELPQLLNVLRLEMSLVGPRPSPFRENQQCIPWRDGRLSVRPGITGLWQVCRNRRAQGDFHQWIQFDLLYVRHMSFAVDLKILAATVLSLGGQWPVPLAWILPRADEDGAARRPLPVALRDAPPLTAVSSNP